MRRSRENFNSHREAYFCHDKNMPLLMMEYEALVTFATMWNTRLSVKFLARKVAPVVDKRISLSDLDLFQGFDASEIEALMNLFEWNYAPEGALLFEQGERAQYIYLLINGEVMVRYKPEDGPALTVARLRQEGVVGWSAVVGSPTYTSSVVCETDCVMLKARNEALRDYLEHNPAGGARLLDRLAGMIAERMRNSHSQVMALIEQGLRVRVPRSPVPG